MDNMASQPHIAILNIQIQIHATTNMGECSGNMVKKELLEQLGIPPNLILSVSGMDLEECVKNLKRKLKEWNMGENNDNNRT